jgi:alpha-glucosidase
MKQIKIQSPDQKFKVKIDFRTNGKKKNILSYCIIDKDNITILNWSNLGLKLKKKRNNCQDFFSNWSLINIEKRSIDEIWKPILGERDTIPNKFNEIVIYLEKTNKNKRFYLNIQFRIFNEGIGIRYIIPNQKNLSEFTITNEITQFSLIDGSWCYEEHGSEGEYYFKPVPNMKLYAERPLTVVSNRDSEKTKYLVITDANVHDYSAMRLKPVNGGENKLKVSLGAQNKVIYPGETIFRPKNIFDKWIGKVKGKTPFETAWRVIIIGDKPGELIEKNYIVENLCEECKIKDTSWIKPGKVIRDMLMTTQSSKNYVDFAKKYGIDYVHWDAGWYGPEGNVKSDPTTITLDHKKLNISDDTQNMKQERLKFHKAIKNAKDNGIGVWVYVNRRHLELYLDEILPLYKSWGIDGIKFGFVKYGPQQCMKWLIDAVKKCADYEIMVDIHDAYRPSGLSRTYPNLLTQEGIRGNEHRPTPTHNCTLPFTRFCSGAADYTISYYINKVQTTHTHQIALSIIYYSPLQFLFWYDNPDHFGDEPELNFFKELPTTWDNSLVLDGKIGKYVTIARKKGEKWFIGAITNEEECNKVIELKFLDSNKNYKCVMYFDDFNLDTTTKVGIKEFQINNKEEIKHKINGSGGLVLIIKAV